MEFQTWFKSREYKPRNRLIYDCSRAQTACSGGKQWIERMEVASRLRGHGGCVNTVLFSHHQQGLFTYTGSDDQCIAIWNTDMVCSGNHNCRESRNCKFLNTSHVNNIFYVRDLPHSQGSEIVTCAADGKVILHSLPDSGGHYEQVLARHHGRAHRIALTSHSPNMICTAGEDGKINIVDLRGHGMDITSRLSPMYMDAFECFHLVAGTTQFKSPFVDHAEGPCSVYSINLHPEDPTKLIAAGESPAVSCYDTRKMDQTLYYYIPMEKLKGSTPLGDTSEPHITAVKYNYDGTELLASYSGGCVYSFDAINHAHTVDDLRYISVHEPIGDSTFYRQKFEGHRNIQTVKQVSYHGQRSEYVVSGCDSGHVFIYNASDGAIIKVLKADDRGAINCLASHPLDNVIATSGLSSYATFFRPLGSRTPADSAEEKERIEKIIKENDDMPLSHAEDMNALINFAFHWLERNGEESTVENVLALASGLLSSQANSTGLTSRNSDSDSSDSSDSDSDSSDSSNSDSDSDSDSHSNGDLNSPHQRSAECEDFMDTQSQPESNDGSENNDSTILVSNDDNIDNEECSNASMDSVAVASTSASSEQRRIEQEMRAMMKDEDK